MTTKKINFFEKIVYGSGDVGLNAGYTLFSAYVLYFYTDVIGMNPAIIGGIILISKVFDGFSDMIAGYWVDTHKTKRGHCIPILMKWSIPMVLSCSLVFLLPDANIVIRAIYVFITYNLFSTVFYTLVGLAHNALAAYVTDDSVARSQMLCYKMLFAAGTQMTMANVILPLVNLLGGQQNQFAWVKASLLFGVIGLVFMYLNVLVVKERVQNDAPPENVFQGIKVAIKNKYWWMTVAIQFCCSLQLMFNLTISVYYLNSVINNLGLMGTYVTLSNLPGVFLMFLIPLILHKVSKRNLAFLGTILCLIAQIIFCLSPTSSVTMLFVTALIRGIGFAFIMGLVNAMTADTIEYGEWKTGIRVQAVLFSAKSVSEKVGQGLLTAAFGFFLTMIGYDGLAKVQTSTTVGGIESFFKYVPIVVYIILIIVLLAYKLDKEFPGIINDLKDRKAAKANSV
ncbi:MAG: glycoside-pentoside-hexuronide (GPH):cation symporter [Treponema sp.]|nr:glycoside-pentoside-hexuronide (GPH):cation symporter [Treponema sp.]